MTDGRGHDRQILVVGDGLAAASTTAFLEQAGLDPVLASSTDERTHPGVLTIWQPGLALLERLGLRRPVERLGTPLTGLACRTSGRSWTVDAGDRPSLVAIRRDRLEELLDQSLFDRVRTAERSVTAVESTGTGVRATFEQGIEEPFDTVVTSVQSLVGGAPQASPVHTWEFEWPSGIAVPEESTEAWDGSHAVFSVPVSDGMRARLVSAAETAPATAVSVEELAAQFDHLLGPLADSFPSLDQHDVQYSRTPQVVPASLSVDGVTLVGPAARASLPGDCLGATLGIEDAWVLADALAYGPADIDAALETYETRRRRRANELSAVTRKLAGDSTGLAPPLGRLRAARRLAFSHVLEDRTPDAVQAVPDRL